MPGGRSQSASQIAGPNRWVRLESRDDWLGKLRLQVLGGPTLDRRRTRGVQRIAGWRLDALAVVVTKRSDGELERMAQNALDVAVLSTAWIDFIRVT